MFTRQDYLNHKCTHEQYYSQFVTPGMLKVLSDTVFKSYVSDTKGPKILAGDYTPAFAVELMAKDLELTLDLAKDLKMPVPITNVAKDIAYAAISHGKAKLDYCAIASVYEMLANLELSASDQKG